MSESVMAPTPIQGNLDVWASKQRRLLVVLAEEAEATGDDLGSDEFSCVDGTGASAVHAVLRGCLQRPTAAREQLVLDALHGGFGDVVGHGAWIAVLCGVSSGANEARGGSTATNRIRFPELALASGSLSLLRGVVDAGPPKYATERAQSYSRGDYLSLLCSTQVMVEMSIDLPGINIGPDGSMVATSLAPRFLGSSELVEAGLAYAMEMQPEHRDWRVFAEQPTAEGALVRRFLMQHHIQATVPRAAVGGAAEACSNAVADEGMPSRAAAQGPQQSLGVRRRRTGL